MDIKNKKNKVGVLSCVLMIRKSKLPAVILLLFWLIPAGCQQTRQFDDAGWNWPKWLSGKTATSAPASSDIGESDKAKVMPKVSNNMFSVRILKNFSTDRELREVWSYLDEVSPISTDWQMLHRNGLRCGIGQYSDWPAVRSLLEKSGTKIQGNYQLTLNGSNPMNLLSDKLRSERTLFYYDRNGRVHGRDFGPSMMQFTMVAAGRISGDRVRAVFIPRLFKPENNLERLMPAENKRSMTEVTLENFNITVDLGAEEFALIGPSVGEMADSLIGSQLFLGWDKGQRLSYFILISPMPLESQ